MKMQRLMTIAAAGLLALSGAVLVSCAPAAAAGDTSNFAGTAKAYQVVHQSGILAEAVVSTDADGNVTSAAINEWMDPSSWVYSTGTNGALVGAEVIRVKMAGKNAGFSAFTDAASNAAVDGYEFFYYNATSKGWVQISPDVKPTAPVAIPSLPVAPAVMTAVLPNFDLKMSGLNYAKAYCDASAAVTASASNTDLTTVTFTDASGNFTAATTVTVGTNNAAFQITQRASKAAVPVAASGGALNKSDLKSAYFPMKAKSGTALGQLGYRTNLARLIATFKANPTANYAGATKLNVYTSAWVAASNPTADIFDVTVTIPAATYNLKLPTATVGTGDVLNNSYTAAVWTINGAVDGLTGATFSDFPNYALGLQNAYLYAVAEAKSGNLRTVQ